MKCDKCLFKCFRYEDRKRQFKTVCKFGKYDADEIGINILEEDAEKCEKFTECIPVESYSVIYSVSMPWGVSVRRYRPNSKAFSASDVEGSKEEGYISRKYCALLSPKQFDKFVEDLHLSMSETKTMGSLGAPGHDIFWMPAASFEEEDYDYGVWMNAYVTPNPVIKDPVLPLFPEEKMDYPWEELEKELMLKYGD